LSALKQNIWGGVEDGLHVVLGKGTNVLEELLPSSLWGRRQQYPLKFWYLFIKLRGVFLIYFVHFNHYFLLMYQWNVLTISAFIW